MKGEDSPASARGIELVNLQKRYRVPAASVRAFALNLKSRLRLGKKKFNICFVDDSAIRSLNLAFRGKDKPTDVLSFPWNEAGRPLPAPALVQLDSDKTILAADPCLDFRILHTAVIADSAEIAKVKL